MARWIDNVGQRMGHLSPPGAKTAGERHDHDGMQQTANPWADPSHPVLGPASFSLPCLSLHLSLTFSFSRSLHHREQTRRRTVRSTKQESKQSSNLRRPPRHLLVTARSDGMERRVWNQVTCSLKTTRATLPRRFCTPSDSRHAAFSSHPDGRRLCLIGKRCTMMSNKNTE